jgi:hypothetical protein
MLFHKDSTVTKTVTTKTTTSSTSTTSLAADSSHSSVHIQEKNSKITTTNKCASKPATWKIFLPTLHTSNTRRWGSKTDSCGRGTAFIATAKCFTYVNITTRKLLNLNHSGWNNTNQILITICSLPLHISGRITDIRVLFIQGSSCQFFHHGPIAP